MLVAVVLVLVFGTSLSIFIRELIKNEKKESCSN